MGFVEVESSQNTTVINECDQPSMEYMEEKEEIKQWLINDVGLAKYYSTFVSNGYDSLRFILDIDSEKVLEELGIVLKGHKRRILREIEKLRRNDDDEMIIPGMPAVMECEEEK